MSKDGYGSRNFQGTGGKQLIQLTVCNDTIPSEIEEQ